MTRYTAPEGAITFEEGARLDQDLENATRPKVDKLAVKREAYEIKLENLRIKLEAKEREAERKREERESRLSTHEIAVELGFDPKTVKSWVNKGLLRVLYTTESGRAYISRREYYDLKQALLEGWKPTTKTPVYDYLKDKAFERNRRIFGPDWQPKIGGDDDHHNH